MVASLFLLSLLITSTVAALDSWTPPQTQPKTWYTLMVSIDERLHTLENAKLDSTLRNMEQKLEALENNFRKLDSTVQERLDKLERNLNSKELKDELMVEKLSHKVRDILDTSYDRYSRRLGYTEERLDMSLKKVQMSVEGILNRMEKQQEDIQTDVTETVTMMEDLKAYYLTTDDKLNSTHKAIHQHIQSLVAPSRDELQRISGSLDHISTHLNSSLRMYGSQNDEMPNADLVSTIRNEINSESSKIANKMNNMYLEMWRRVMSVESLLKELGRLGNVTRQEVLKEVRSLVSAERDSAGDSQSNFIQVALDVVDLKFQKLGRSLDDHMSTLTARQDMLIDSCFDNGMCEGLEHRLSNLLEDIFTNFSDKIEKSSNKTTDLYGLVIEIMELLKSQHSHLIRTVSHNTNMVITLAKDNSDANKLIYNDITQLVNHFQDLKEDIKDVSNSTQSFCIRNKTSTNLQTPTQVPLTNITEVKFTFNNITEKPIDKTEKTQDVGVLKITTDNFAILGDNTSISSEDKPHMFDTSVMRVITTISPNLTTDQVESLLIVLNSSVSFDNLAAIVQNTEEDSEGDELDTQTNTEDSLVIGDGEVVDFASSIEIETISEEEITTTDNTAIDTATLNVTETNKSHIELSGELKENLKVYAFLWKIKHGNVNVTLLKHQLENINDSESVQLLTVLQKLCYNEDIHDDILRNRLILIKQVLNNKVLYDMIESICTRMYESLRGQNIQEDIVL